VQQRTKQSANFILLWGDLSGTDPRTAPTQYRFDPDSVLSQLEVYRRITGISQAELNRRVGEYAAHDVTWDYGNRATVMPFINQLYPFITAYNGVPVEAVDQAAGHYRISDALARPTTATTRSGWYPLWMVA
jgi:hypothetical protein